MVDLSKLKTGWFEHRTDVPKWVSSGVGQVAIEWSVVERELEELVRQLLDIDIQPARILVNWMNARTRGFTSAHLTQSRIIHKSLTAVHLQAIYGLTKRADSLQTKRDQLVHGLWGKHLGKWHILKMRQSRKTPELLPELASLARAVIPQREEMTPRKLADVAKEISSLSHDVVAFCRLLQSALAPLQHTPPEYTRRKRDYHRARKTKVR